MEEKSFSREILSKNVNVLLKYENYSMKIFKFFSILEFQGV